MAKVVNSVTDLIGGTPLVRLNRIVPEGSAEIYLKLEYQNPGSSVKDRIALSIVEEAEKEGLLKYRRHDCRSNQRQYRYWPCACSCSQRL